MERFMTDQYTKAKFWKCALQVNPVGYIVYRGADHGMTAEQYNTELVRVAKENGIKVIGLADHGNVDSIDAIRTVMNAHDILVFPGFEITSTEKAHFVCLFPETTSKDRLSQYLFALGLTGSGDGAAPSNLGGNDLLAKVDEWGGFAYAAHCTADSGVLRQKLVHVWQNPLLRAVQIPGDLAGLKDAENNSYFRILTNVDANYRREQPVAIINAKDVARPEDLANPKASCLIKMTRPSFESFKLAFQDPESRVRLNSDVSQKYYSWIESLQITGGYLNDVRIEFSEHLNAVIGGRGTGKSTLLECIRYALQLKPIGKNAQKQHDEIIRENLGKSKARVELVIRSSQMNGKRFTVARRYGESPSVKDENDNLSAFVPSDLLPGIEIYGQNEIYEIAQDKASQRQLLTRFLETEVQDGEERIRETLRKLAENRKKLVDAQAQVSLIEDEVARLPKLEEQLGQFKVLGLEEKLKIVPLLESEKRLQKRATEEEGENLNMAFQTVRDSLPDTLFLSDSAIEMLPHAARLRRLRMVLDRLRGSADTLLAQWSETYGLAKAEIASIAQELNAGIQQEEAILEQTFKELPAFEGKSGREIGVAFQNLLREIERIRPKKILMANRTNVVAELRRQRQSILEELSSLRAERSAKFERALKRLNRKLSGKLRLKVKPEGDRTPIIQFLMGCKLEGVGEARLAWIREAEDFSPVKLAELIQVDATDLFWDVTPTVREALRRLTNSQLLQLEEIELPDVISIELNTAHEGNENFKPLDKLSTGQQCTAILHLLLLENRDPLLMDQPEDNLDNAFIADRIVAELRSAKMARQFIFATHNANIPVFGDAEWIGVFEAQENHAFMPAESQGAIDVKQVCENAANILEGGKAAFNQRKAKYGF